MKCTKSRLYIILLSLCSFVSACGREMNQDYDVVTSLFEWFKGSYEDLKSVPTAAELERFFAPISKWSATE